jgi:uncharacterized membrane protein
MNPLLQAALASFSPLAEMQLGIPLAIAQGVHPVTALLACMAANTAIVPIVYLFLNSLHRFLLRIPLYNKFATRYLDRARRQMEAKYHTWEDAGILILMAIPLPFTGTYTCAAAAWAFGLKFRHAFPLICIGVLIAALVILAATYGVMGAISLF